MQTPPHTGPDAGEAATGLPEQLLLLMMASSRLMMTEAGRAIPEMRLTPPQFRMLNLIYRRPKMSLSQLAQLLGVRLPTASVMLVKLAQEGLVTRDRDPSSRRRMQLELTAQGRQIMDQVRATLFAELDARLARLTTENRAAVERAMPALRTLFPE